MVIVDEIKVHVVRRGGVFTYYVWVKESEPGKSDRSRTVKRTELPDGKGKKYSPLSVGDILEHVLRPPIKERPKMAGTLNDDAMGTIRIPVQKFSREAGVSAGH
jgi:hypothetical protein